MKTAAPHSKARGLVAERCQSTIRGWAVSSTEDAEKGSTVGGVTPLLAHQTLANRNEVLACATCHRFVGTESTQLAMTQNPTSRDSYDSRVNVSRKRRREVRSNAPDVAGSLQEGGGSSSEDRAPRTPKAASRRSAVLEKLLAKLPDLPALHDGDSHGDCDVAPQEAGTTAVATTPAAGPGRVPPQSPDRPATGSIASLAGAREAVAGFPCLGGAPCEDVYCTERCRRAAGATGHGLLCVGGMAAGSPLYEARRHAMRSNETYIIAATAIAAALSSPEGSRFLEAVADWHAPLPPEWDGKNAAHGHSSASEERGVTRCSRRSHRENAQDREDGDGRTAQGLGVPLDEAEEAWSMLAAGLISGRNDPARSCWRAPDKDAQRILSFDFFARAVRALERHLAPIAVPSPLVRYCSRLVHADRATKTRALPWLQDAINGARADDTAPGPVSPSIGSKPQPQPQQPATTAKAPFESLRKRLPGTSISASGDDPGTTAGACPKDERELASERGLCRLAQAATSATTVGTASAAGPLCPFPPLSVVGLLPPCASPSHSCIPNVQLEATLVPPLAEGRLNAAIDTNGDAGISTDYSPEATGTALRIELVALRSIRAGDELSAPYVALGQPVTERQRDLLPKFGSLASARQGPLCRCPRCLLEGEAIKPGGVMLKVLADQALEEGRHDDALGLYKAALDVLRPVHQGKPTNEAGRGGEETDEATVYGDALYGVGVALLAAGRFWAARRTWRRGVELAPWHSALRAQAEKEAAYRPQEARLPDDGGAAPSTDHATARAVRESRTGAKGLAGISSCSLAEAQAMTQGNSLAAYRLYAPRGGGSADIIMSTEAVLSPSECDSVIEAASDYAKANGGWTTSRHYAVPTTDLPVHVVKPLVPWFRKLLSERLFPVLAEHFSLKGGPRKIAVHDAFVVRYHEDKQRHLPLHRDQSTHSFTIALNGLDEYRGGGTYFPSMQRALRPPKGHALAFPGGVLHGGDPLLGGVRYIIACFCYYDEGGDGTMAETSGGDTGGATRSTPGQKRYDDSVSFDTDAATIGAAAAASGESVGCSAANHDCVQLARAPGPSLRVTNGWVEAEASPQQQQRAEEENESGGQTREEKAGAKLEFRRQDTFSFSFGGFG